MTIFFITWFTAGFISAVYYYIKAIKPFYNTELIDFVVLFFLFLTGYISFMSIIYAIFLDIRNKYD